MEKWPLLGVALVAWSLLLGGSGNHDSMCPTEQNLVDAHADTDTIRDSEQKPDVIQDSFLKRYKKELLCGVALCSALIGIRYYPLIARVTDHPNNMVTTDSVYQRDVSKIEHNKDLFYIAKMEKNSITAVMPQDRTRDLTSSNIIVGSNSDAIKWEESRMYSLPSTAAGTTITCKNIDDVLTDLYVCRGRECQYVIISRGINNEINVDPALQQIYCFTSHYLEFSVPASNILVMSTAEAVEKYNALVDQGYKVLALLHTQCT